MISRTRFLAQGLIVACLALPRAAAAVAPGGEWRTLQTPNFRLHHTREQVEFTRAFAAQLERYLPLLTRDLAWRPPTPIDIVVNDRSDLANGIAQNFPANRMEVYPVPFDSESTLMDYYDWIEELAVHELTHIVANDGATGFYRTLRGIFGNAIRPNGLQPGWIIEGLAVFEESRLTSGGRGRSIVTEALLRTATLYKKLDAEDYLSLDRFNDGVFWWPAGHTRYLLGYAVQAALERKRTELKEIPKYGHLGQSVPGLLSIGGTRNFPYALDGNLEDITGRDWAATWKETQALLEARYLHGAGDDPEQAAAGECRLTKAGRFTGGQVVGRDGKIYFSVDHPSLGRALARMPLHSPCLPEKNIRKHAPEQETVNFEVLQRGLKRASGTKLALSPDGKLLAYAELGHAQGGREVFDIHILDLATRDSEQLTRERRAREPAFSEDGKEVVYVRMTDDGIALLEAIELGSRRTRELFRSGRFHRLNGTFVREGRVYFSRHNNRGQEEIFYVPLRGGKAERAIPNFGKGEIFSERNPFVLPDGTIYFTATYHAFHPDFGGVRHEIYAWKEGAPRPARLTRTLSGLSLWPIPLADNQVLVANYGLSGLDLTRVATRGGDEPRYANPRANANRRKPASLDTTLGEPEAPSGAAGANLHEFLTNTPSSFAKAPPLAPAPAAATATAGESVAYDTFSTPATSLWPQYWLPVYFTVTEGSLIGAATSGSDPLQRNRYTLVGMYDTRAAFPSYMATYTNTAHALGFGLLAMQDNNYFSGSNLSNRDNYYSAQLLYTLFGVRVGVGGGFQQRRLGTVARDNPFVFNRITVGGRTLRSALPLAPDKGIELENYVAYFPKTRFELPFWELRTRVTGALPGLTPSHATGLSASLGSSTNRTLASNYYQGGGPVSGIETRGSYIVRGYPEDTLFGQRIFVANATYTLPLVRIYRGWGINPFYVSTFGLRLVGDAGSSIYTARYARNTFLGYTKNRLGREFIYGIGADFLLNSTVGYYAPLEATLGIHRGLNQEYGGETRFFFGLNVGSLPGL